MQRYIYAGSPVGEVLAFDKSGEGRALPVRLDLVNHSPTGFAWGYSGSGPAQLALALLAWECNEQYAIEHYQEFKREVVAALDEEWVLTGADIRRWNADTGSGLPDEWLYNGCQGCRPPCWCDYSHLEVKPVKEDDGHCEVLEEAREHLADFWSIYGRRKSDGTAEVITDVPSEKVADLIAARFSRHAELVVIDKSRILEGGA